MSAWYCEWNYIVLTRKMRIFWERLKGSAPQGVPLDIASRGQKNYRGLDLRLFREKWTDLFNQFRVKCRTQRRSTLAKYGDDYLYDVLHYILHRRTGRHCAGVDMKWEDPLTPWSRTVREHFTELLRQRQVHTFGPSLIRTLGIPRRGIEVVFHQLGPPNREIFSSVESWLTRAGILASRNERDMAKRRVWTT